MFNGRQWLVRDIAQVILFATIGAIIVVALCSYDSNDPSFNVSTHQDPQNILRYFGAYLADLLYQSFGAISFLFAVAVIIWAVLVFYYGALSWIWVRVVILVIAVSGCSIIFVNTLSKSLPAGGGGSVAVLLSQLLERYSMTEVGNIRTSYIIFTISIIMYLGCLGIESRAYVRLLKLLFILPVFMLFRMYKLKVKAERADDDKILAAKLTTKQSKLRESCNKILPVFFSDDSPDINKFVVQDSSLMPASRNNTNDKISKLPPVDLLCPLQDQRIKAETQLELQQRSEELLKVLNDFGVKGQIVDISRGPVVTLYEFEPAAGTKSSRIIGLADDIARSLSAVSTRISNIPGRNVLGIELPNEQRRFFCMRELIETDEYQNSDVILPLVLGKDLAGRPFIADLAKMPHLLVAGTTGSGKSVAINAMILSLLYRYTAKECRFIMIDPKMLELSIYDNIPHLLTPVVTEPSKAIIALKWVVREMENRYRLMSNLSVRNIASYNLAVSEALHSGKKLQRMVQTGFDHETGLPVYESIPISMETLPLIVVIVDEMADLMMVAGKEIEISIQRLAQMARAAGIHLIMATQRPSVDVITGVIKANFPSRISFKVTSRIDSRTIIGEQGAEQLLGMGDMLYMGNVAGVTRVHGPFVNDKEIEQVVLYLRSIGNPEYINAITQAIDEDDAMPLDFNDNNSADDIYTKAVNIIKSERKVSISYIQRCLRIGYNRAADIVDRMEREGLISAPNSVGKREILLPEE